MKKNAIAFQQWNNVYKPKFADLLPTLIKCDDYHYQATFNNQILNIWPSRYKLQYAGQVRQFSDFNEMLNFLQQRAPK